MSDIPPTVADIPPVLLVPILEAAQIAADRRYATRAVGLVTPLSPDSRQQVRAVVVDTMARGIAMLAALEAMDIDEEVPGA